MKQISKIYFNEYSYELSKAIFSYFANNVKISKALN